MLINRIGNIYKRIRAMSDQDKKIIHIQDSLQNFYKNYVPYNMLKSIGIAITSVVLMPINAMFIRPFAKISENDTGYTTKEQMDWFKAKDKPMTKSTYKKMVIYTDSKNYKKSLSKIFRSYASYEMIKDSVDQAHDYSNDPNIVQIPKPLTRKEQKQLGRKKGN